LAGALGGAGLGPERGRQLVSVLRGSVVGNDAAPDDEILASQHACATSSAAPLAAAAGDGD
jgi:hypothetical protein